MGHSYGSVTAGVSARQPTGVDQLVIMAAPGAGTNDVDELQVPAGRVYVVESNNDPVADLAAFGVDPNQLDGAVNLSTQAEVGPEGQLLRASSGHQPVGSDVAYLGRGTTSQFNVANVIIGRRDRIVENDNWDGLDYVNAPSSWLSGN